MNFFSIEIFNMIPVLSFRDDCFCTGFLAARVYNLCQISDANVGKRWEMNQLIELRLKFPPQARSSSADECSGWCHEHVEYDWICGSSNEISFHSKDHKTTSEWTHAAAATLPATVSTERNKALVPTKHFLAEFLGPTESRTMNIRLRLWFLGILGHELLEFWGGHPILHDTFHPWLALSSTGYHHAVVMFVKVKIKPSGDLEDQVEKECSIHSIHCLVIHEENRNCLSLGEASKAESWTSFRSVMKLRAVSTKKTTVFIKFGLNGAWWHLPTDMCPPGPMFGRDHGRKGCVQADNAYWVQSISSSSEAYHMKLLDSNLKVSSGRLLNQSTSSQPFSLPELWYILPQCCILQQLTRNFWAPIKMEKAFQIKRKGQLQNPELRRSYDELYMYLILFPPCPSRWRLAIYSL